MVKRKNQSNRASKILLIILGIIVVFAVTGYVIVKREVVEPVQQNMKDAEGKSRDSARKSALRTYSAALELYKSQNRNYPVSISCSSPQTLNLEISNAPKEPFRDQSLNKQDSNWPDFCYQSDPKGTKFTVWAKLENSSGDKTSQINTTPYFTIPSGFEPNYYFMQSEE